MRLAIVRRRLVPTGGAERSIENTIEALAGTGIETTLVSESAEAAPAGGGRPARMVRLPPAGGPLVSGGRYRRYRAFQAAVAGVLAEGSFDVVQSHERILDAHLFRAGDGVHAAWIDRLGRERRWWRRRLLEADRFHRHLIETERRMARQTDMTFVANSPMIARELADWLDLPAARIRTIENGVDLAAFRPPTPEERMEARARFGLSMDDRVVAFAGSGFERKGAFALVRAFGAGRLRGKKALIAGRDKRSGRLGSLIRRLGLEDRVTMLGAVADVARLLHAGDVFVLPTLYDPMPNAAIEAIACGLPVVTTPDAGIGDVVVEHGAGCVSGRGAEALSAAIAETFDDLEARRRAAIGLRDRFGLSRATARWLDLYRERM